MKDLKRRGPSSKKKLSDLPVKEQEKLAEAEFRRLQKQFQIAAEKRRSYAANVRQQMQAQEKQIKSLSQEHEEVLLEMKKIMSPRNAMLDDRNCREVHCLLQTKYQYDSLIRDRKALLADLDNQILELEKRIVRENKIAGKAKQAKSSKRLQKQIERLETHLNNVTVHFNTILTRNNKLREEIKNLQIWKATLDNLYLKLHKKLEQQWARMNTAVEQSTQAYEQWMETLARISAIKERHSKDTVQYKVEMQERERVLDQETKLKTFTLTKFTDRSELEEQAKKKRDLKAAQKAKQSQGESFESREVAYRRLLDLAGDGDIDRLLNGFIKKEEKSFACFSYAIELNNEMAKMQQRIKDLEDEITTLRTDRECAERSSLHNLKKLEEKLARATEKANWYEDRCKESSKFLGQLKSDMESLFKDINCDATEITKRLGENGRITDLNLMQFFGLVDKKTNELLLMESVLRWTSSDDSLSAPTFTNPLLDGTGLLYLMDRSRICPLPPDPDGTTDVTDAFEAPLDHGQLRQLILQSWEKEQGNTTSKGKKGRKGVKV